MPTAAKFQLDFPHKKEKQKLVLFNLKYAFHEVPESFAEVLFTAGKEIAASKNILVWTTYRTAHMEHEMGGHFRPSAKKGGKGGEILINSSLTIQQQVHVLWHELAHASIPEHHDGTYYKEHRGSCEVEAETVAYNLDRFFYSGFDPLWNFSHHYIQNWASKPSASNIRLPVAVQTFQHLLHLYETGAGKEIMDRNRAAKRASLEAERKELALQERIIFADRKRFAEEIQFV